MEIVEPSLSVVIRVTLIMKSWRSGKRIMIIGYDNCRDVDSRWNSLSFLLSLSLKDSILYSIFCGQEKRDGNISQ